MVRQDVATSESVSMQGSCNAAKDEVEALQDTGLLVGGALPSFQVEDEAGQAELLASVTQDPVSIRKRKTRGKDNAQEIRPRTPREEAKAKAADVLKWVTKANEIVLTLDAKAYGGDLKKDIRKFAKVMQELYKKLTTMVSNNVRVSEILNCSLHPNPYKLCLQILYLPLFPLIRKASYISNLQPCMCMATRNSANPAVP